MHEHPILALLETFHTEDHAIDRLLPKTFKAAKAIHGGRGHEKLQSRSDLRCLRSLNERRLLTLAAFERLLPTAPPHWQRTMHDIIMQRCGELAEARCYLTAVRSIYDAPERLPEDEPVFRLH